MPQPGEPSLDSFRTLIERSWDTVALIGADAIARYVSPSIQRVLGYTPEEFVGRNVLDLVHPDDLPRIAGLFAELLAHPDPAITDRFRYRHRDGSWVWLEGTGTNLLADPNVQAVVAVYRDVTEQERLKDELRRRAEALAEADRRKTEFLHMLAHELCSPLAPILNAVQVLRLTADPVKREQAGEMAARQVRHLSRLLDDLLDMSRLNQNKIRLRRERLDLARLVRTAVGDQRATVERTGLKLSVTVPETPVWVRGDATRLTQVVGNLLDNAARFTEAGGEVRVRVTASPDGRWAEVHVQDTGAGIEPDLLGRLFEPFHQGSQDLPRPKGGLGLGLALVKGLVELHGGTVEACSEGPGRGSEFVVRLPPEQEPPALSRGLHDARRNGDRLRILVIEDNKDAADSLRVFLELLGHEVAVAYTGPEGVNTAGRFRPAVVLCDIGLPGLDGYGVARELRRDPATAGSRLIAVTGYGSDEDRRRSREAGFDLHLTKPVDPIDLEPLLTWPGRPEQ
jgi:PAS domain S-box-containing protein